MVTAEIERGTSEQKALEPFLVFVGGEWPSVGDEACFQYLKEAFQLSTHMKLGEGIVRGEQRKERGRLIEYAVLNLSMYRNMNGMIQRNTSKIHPVSDFHTFVDNEVSKLSMTESKGILVFCYYFFYFQY